MIENYRNFQPLLRQKVTVSKRHTKLHFFGKKRFRVFRERNKGRNKKTFKMFLISHIFFKNVKKNILWAKMFDQKNKDRNKKKLQKFLVSISHFSFVSTHVLKNAEKKFFIYLIKFSSLNISR